MLPNESTRDTGEHPEPAALDRVHRQALKMEAVSRFSEGIARDANNMLSVILGFTEMALSDLPAGSPVWRHLDEVLKAGYRIADLMEYIVLFSKGGFVKNPRPVGVASLIEDCISQARNSVPFNIEIQFECTALDSSTIGDPRELRLMIRNLMTNAIDAMKKDGGTLKIGLRDELIDHGSSLAKDGLTPGRYLVLTVADTGEGIDPHILDHIFDPYFTTKPIGQGKGLGLTAVYGIVDRLDGKIDVFSHKGPGATFEVLLPGFRTDAPVDRPCL